MEKSGCTPSPLRCNGPFAMLIEQPTSNPHKFRYESEQRVKGGTYIIEVFNYEGPAEIYTSCVTAERPYKAHPHKVMGMKGDNIRAVHGSCWTGTINISPGKNKFTFSKLGILRVKKDGTEVSLRDRMKLGKAGDPFCQQFSHLNVDLKEVRLCFEVFILNTNTKCLDEPLEPVLSNIISIKPDLRIFEVSKCCGFVDEEAEVFLFCNKVEKNDIFVQFYQSNVFEKEDAEWRADATIKYIHQGVGIIFKAPKYPFAVSGPVKCQFQLYRGTDGKMSNSCDFEYYPTPQKGKRRRTIDNLSTVLEELELASRPPSSSSASVYNYMTSEYYNIVEQPFLQQSGLNLVQQQQYLQQSSPKSVHSSTSTINQVDVLVNPQQYSPIPGHTSNQLLTSTNEFIDGFNSGQINLSNSAQPSKSTNKTMGLSNHVEPSTSTNEGMDLGKEVDSGELRNAVSQLLVDKNIPLPVLYNSSLDFEF